MTNDWLFLQQNPLFMKFGILKEGKTPPDKRVPLTPSQCRQLMDRYPQLEIVVQTSNIRAFPDEAYAQEGIEIVDDLSSCDVLFGVKEVPKKQLLADKTYFFFSHTIKEQPYNQQLLQTIVEKNIQLVDYETLTNQRGTRLIGFGRYAGIVGCYNGLRAYGIKSGAYELKPAHECFDRKELELELKKVVPPANFKIALTGLGRVATGAIEILDLIALKKVTPNELLNNTYDEAVFAQLNVKDYNARNDGQEFEKRDFYEDPTDYYSTFPRFLEKIDLYIACHYWDSRAPFLFTREDLKSNQLQTNIVADISCDIDGPVASTLRPSTIADPLYGYDPLTESETDFKQENSIGVMAVDNLPCELPKDASEDFGKELVEKIIPPLLENDPEDIIGRATITKNRKLTEHYSYLQNYLDNK